MLEWLVAIACSAARLGLEAQNAAAFRLLRMAGRIVAPTPNRGLRAIAGEPEPGRDARSSSPQKGRRLLSPVSAAQLVAMPVHLGLPILGILLVHHGEHRAELEAMQSPEGRQSLQSVIRLL